MTRISSCRFPWTGRIYKIQILFFSLILLYWFPPPINECSISTHTTPHQTKPNKNKQEEIVCVHGKVEPYSFYSLVLCRLVIGTTKSSLDDIPAVSIPELKQVSEQDLDEVLHRTKCSRIRIHSGWLAGDTTRKLLSLFFFFFFCCWCVVLHCVALRGHVVLYCATVPIPYFYALTGTEKSRNRAHGTDKKQLATVVRTIPLVLVGPEPLTHSLTHSHHREYSVCSRFLLSQSALGFSSSSSSSARR